MNVTDAEIKDQVKAMVASFSGNNMKGIKVTCDTSHGGYNVIEINYGGYLKGIYKVIKTSAWVIVYYVEPTRALTSVNEFDELAHYLEISKKFHNEFEWNVNNCRPIPFSVKYAKQ